MSDNVASRLLESVPKGEAIKDPRENDYPEAIFQGGEVVKNSTGTYAYVATYGNLRNADGIAFEHKQRYNLPETRSDVVVKRIFRDVLKSHGLLPAGQMEPLLFDSDEARAQLAEAFAEIRGTNVPIRLVPRKNSDFLDARVRSPRMRK